MPGEYIHIGIWIQSTEYRDTATDTRSIYCYRDMDTENILQIL
jgi:hypothetical protein